MVAMYCLGLACMSSNTPHVFNFICSSLVGSCMIVLSLGANIVVFKQHLRITMLKSLRVFKMVMSAYIPLAQNRHSCFCSLWYKYILVSVILLRIFALGRMCTHVLYALPSMGECQKPRCLPLDTTQIKTLRYTIKENSIDQFQFMYSMSFIPFSHIYSSIGSVIYICMYDSDAFPLIRCVKPEAHWRRNFCRLQQLQAKHTGGVTLRGAGASGCFLAWKSTNHKRNLI